MIEVEFENRSGKPGDRQEIEELARFVLAQEGIERGELGLWLVGSEEMRGLKREHLGIDDVGDVLSFPMDGGSQLASGEPRALGDVFLCPAVVGAEWRVPLVHGLLHLVGYEHGELMARREQELAA